MYKRQRQDGLLGEASRISTAELLVQSLTVAALQGEVLALSTEEGEGPSEDSTSWEALLEQL